MSNYLLMYTHPQKDCVCWAICQPESLQMSDGDAIALVAATIDEETGNPNTPYSLCDPEEIKVMDRYFREAWEWED